MALRPVNNELFLLASVANGNQRAFTNLFDCYYKQIGEYVFKLTESLEITEEIVQDIFIKVWLKRESLPELDSFSNFLFILSKNQTLNYLRKKSKDKVRHSEWLKQHEDEPDKEEESSTIEKYRLLIDQVVNKLPPQQKKAYNLSRIDRLKHEEIAKILNVTPETVNKYIKRALKTIKTEISSPNDKMIVLILTSPLFFLK